MPTMVISIRKIHQSQRTKKYFWLNRLLPRIQRKLLRSRAPVEAPYLRVHAT